MDLASLTLAISLGYSQYSAEEGPEGEPFFKAAVGHEESPLYLWGSHEDLSVRMLGQGIGDAAVSSVGIGARNSWGPFLVYGELGYAHVDEDPEMRIQQEIVYTELLRNHRVDFRPPPVYPTGPYDQDSYETLWELDNGLVGEIGVGYQKGDWSATLGYRPLYVREHIELWDEERREAGRGWWQESRSRNLSSWRFGITYTLR